MANCGIINKPKARKEHKCCECRNIIKKGDIYELSSGIYEDEPYRYKTCLKCAEMRHQAFVCGTKQGMLLEDGIEFGGLHNFIKGELELSEQELAELYNEYKRS